jgi:hypothetical protein
MLRVLLQLLVDLQLLFAFSHFMFNKEYLEPHFDLNLEVDVVPTFCSHLLYYS